MPGQLVGLVCEQDLQGLCMPGAGHMDWALTVDIGDEDARAQMKLCQWHSRRKHRGHKGPLGRTILDVLSICEVH